VNNGYELIKLNKMNNCVAFWNNKIQRQSSGK